MYNAQLSSLLRSFDRHRVSPGHDRVKISPWPQHLFWLGAFTWYEVLDPSLTVYYWDTLASCHRGVAERVAETLKKYRRNSEVDSRFFFSLI
jgi:hypothetical protein